jgi:hypothetical protein
MKRFILMIIVGMTALSLLSCGTNKGSFTLVNKSKESISSASISICGQTQQFMNIRPNDKISAFYRIKSDSHYAVQVEFQSGKKLQSELGYVTNGLDFKDEITVKDSTITIASSEHFK